MSHFFAKVARKLRLEGSHESAQEKEASHKQGGNLLKTRSWSDTCSRQGMANRGKRVHFCNDGGEGEDEPEEAYEVYEVYDYITCVISKMVGGLMRKRKSCNGKERLGTPRPQASGGVRFASQEN